MPAQLDLTGRRLGRLTVVRRSGRMQWGHLAAAWLCQCDCGARLRIPQNRLPHRASIPPNHIVDACRRCRANACVVCGAPVTYDLTATTCSESCYLKHCRRKQREHKRRLATDQQWVEQVNARRRAARRNPEKRAAILATDRRMHRRKRRREMTDPDYRARKQAQRQAAYQRNADEIQHRRRARLAAMSPQQRLDWCDRMREYQRRYASDHRAEIKSDPARHQEYLDLMREYRRQRALLRLTTIGNTLIARSQT